MRPIPRRTESEREDGEAEDEDDSEGPTDDQIMEGEEKWIQAHEFK
ncbi:MAG: hypothetical protein ABEH64_06925 [Salinirussus sp.]